ncbi:MAG: patatin-like phospholipase family protein [Bradymonadia bacterium]
MTLRTALVLSGGGARGAYEAGVLQGLVEALGLRAGDSAPFCVFSGTSVGALNAAFLAGQLDRGDMGADALAQMWCTTPSMRQMVRPDFRGIATLLGLSGGLRAGRGRMPSMLDPGPVARIIEGEVPWAGVQRHCDSGLLQALIVPALHVGTGRTHVFVQRGAGQKPLNNHNDRLSIKDCVIGPDHVRASSAMPLVFPPHLVSGAHYVDGGVRLNTPIAPALRAGVDRLVVVSLHRESRRDAVQKNEAAYANPLYLAGRLLDALLVDGMQGDLHMVARLNQLLADVEGALSPEMAQRFHDIVALRRRGERYRPAKVLVLQPPEDRGPAEEATRFLQSAESKVALGWRWHRALKLMARGDFHALGGLASYLLFDRGYTRRLVALGQETARRHRDEIKAFFAQ